MGFSFLHTADWQLGAKQHPVAYSTFLDKLIEKSRELKTDFILCVGDIFDEHNPNPIHKDQLLKTIINNRDQIFVFTVGNHDYTTKSKEYHSLKYLKIIQKLMRGTLYICDEIGKRYLINLDFDGCKYVSIFPTEPPHNQVPKLAEKAGQKRAKECGDFVISCFHGMLPHFSVKGNNSKKEIEKDLLEIKKSTKCNYVALGDIHKNILIDGFGGYPGALVQKTYACEDGIIHVKVDDEFNISTELINLDLPKKMTVSIELDSLNEEDIVTFVKDNIPNGNLIKLQFSIPSVEYTALNKDYIEKNLSKFFLEVKFSNEPTLGMQKRENLELIRKAKTIEEEIDPLLDEIKDLDKEKLLNVCKGYIE